MPQQPPVPIPLSRGLIVDPIEIDWLDALPVNLVAVPRDVLGSPGYLRSWPGLTNQFNTGGAARGAVNNIPFNQLFRVQGTELIDTMGTVLVDVGGTGHAPMPFSGTTQGIVSGNALRYWDGNQLTQLQNWVANEFTRTWAPEFNNSHIEISMWDPAGSVTLEMEVQLDLAGNTQSVSLLSDSTEMNGAFVQIRPDGDIAVRLQPSGTVFESSSTPIQNNTRHLIRIEIVANTSLTFRVDGIQQFTTSSGITTLDAFDTIGTRETSQLSGQIFNLRLTDEATAANTRFYPMLIVQDTQPTVLTVDTSPVSPAAQGTLVDFPVGQEWSIGLFTDSAATDFDIGEVIDAVYENGRYHWVSRGSGLFGVTDLTNEQRPDFLAPFISAESGFDDNLGIAKWKKLIVVFGRFSIEFFRATGVAEPIYRPDRSLTVQAGIVGPGAKCEYLDTFAIVGGPENEAVSVYLIGQGGYTELATEAVQKVLKTYTDDELALTYMEPVKIYEQEFIIIHLLRDTLVYDHTSSTEKYRRWSILSSSVDGEASYRGIYHIARNNVFSAGDRINGTVSELDFDTASHLGQSVRYQAFTPMMQFRNVSLHDLQVDNIPGYNTEDYRLAFATTYDGKSYGQEKWVDFSKANNRRERVLSRKLGYVRNNIGFRLSWITPTPSTISHMRVRPQP